MVVSAERQGEPQPRMTTTLQSRPTHPMTGDPAVGSTAWVGSPTRIVALSGGKDSTAMALKRERDIEDALARADDASALAIQDRYDPEHHLITLAAEVRRLRGSPDAEPPLPPATCSALCRACGGRGLVPFKGKYVKTPVLCPDCKGNSGAWHVLISSWAGTVWHPVEVIRLSPARSKVRFLDDNIKGKRGSVHTVPTGALRSPNPTI